MSVNDKFHRDLIISWLNDAYSMEKALYPVLEEHAKDAADYPDWSERMKLHAMECEKHMNLLRQSIESLGGDVSTIKSGLGAFTGWVKSVGTGMFQDEQIKNVLSDCGAAYFACACYRSLIDAANHNHDLEIAQTCQLILDEKQEMANWLYNNVPRATLVALHHEEAQQEKKRDVA